jgi:NAD(P)-dependent dehydrogenase (short-subunit alcohol dehydrogenase family)
MKKKKTRPPQSQSHQPGREKEMHPQPESEAKEYRPANKLRDKVALITGGDSGIGRSVATHFAKEGAHVAVVYLEEDSDAKETQQLVEQEDRRCLLIKGDVGQRDFCDQTVQQTVEELGRLDILVNNAAEQHEVEKPEDLTDEQLHRTFATNIFSHFYLVRAALPHMKAGSTIINTTSVTAYQGHKSLLDYSATKGAILAMTRSLSSMLASRDIRVNGVAPGPIWTPLIPASFEAEKVESFGTNTPMGRPGSPDEVAPCYVFLASSDASYMTGQVLHPNGGRVVNG